MAENPGFIGDNFEVVDKILKVDKLALGLLTALVALMLGQLWYVNGNMTRMEIVHAQLEASQRMVLESIKQMDEKGSLPDKRLEVAVQSVDRRLEGLEKAMEAMVELHGNGAKQKSDKVDEGVVRDWQKRSIDRHRLTD